MPCTTHLLIPLQAPASSLPCVVGRVLLSLREATSSTSGSSSSAGGDVLDHRTEDWMVCNSLGAGGAVGHIVT